MTSQAPKKTPGRKPKVTPVNSQDIKIEVSAQNEGALRVTQKRSKKVIESANDTNISQTREDTVLSTEQKWEDVAIPAHTHKIHHHIHKGLSRTGSAWQRVKKLLFSTPALACFSLMMWLSLWSDYQTENVQLSASLQNISEQIMTQWGSGYTVSPDISLVSGIPNSDIVDFVFNKNAKDVKEIRYSLVYDQKKLQFSENLPHFEGCSVDSESVQPMLLNIVMRCNKSHDFEKDVPVISHAFTHVNNSQNENITINVVNIEFSTKDGSTYELAGKSYDLLWRSKGY